jgi:stage II sporulation protein D
MKKLCVTVLYVFFTAVLLPCIVWVAWRGDTKINSGSSAVEYDITKKGRAVDSLESYVASVVAAEMPASYGIEALKAQAVATRTYAVFHGYEGDGEQIAQAFLSEDEKKDRWGTDFEFYDNKIKEAVAATEGEILTVDGHPINAVFHAMSAGATEFAENVWKNPSDCLVAVPCTEDETSPDFLS